MVWPSLTSAGRRSCTTRGRSRRRSAPRCRGRARAVTTCSPGTPPCSLSSTVSCRPTLPRCTPECLYFQSSKGVFVLSERAPRCAPRRAAPYTPRRRQGWHPLHIFCSALNGFGMFCILAAHEHYTLDVLMGLAPAPPPPCICATAVAARTLVALTRGGPVTRRAGFYVSTRTFQSYHAIAHANSAEEGQYPSGEAHKQRRRWFPMVSYLEKNIAGTRGPHPPRFRESRRLVRIEEVGSAVGTKVLVRCAGLRGCAEMLLRGPAAWRVHVAPGAAERGSCRHPAQRVRAAFCRDARVVAARAPWRGAARRRRSGAGRE